MRSIIAASILAIVLVSCGNDEMTLTEYAENVEELTTTMYGTLEELTAGVVQDSPTVEQVQTAYTGMAEAYRRLRDGYDDLDPPEDIAPMHDMALGMMNRLATATEAFAAKANEIETEAELPALFESAEAAAANAASQEMVSFCQDRQAELDATTDREALAGTPWIPAEMQEVVLVAFGCDIDLGAEDQ